MAEISSTTSRRTFAGGVVAVDDVNLTIADGEFMVLVGPSGCGKSTLLRMIAGLEEVTDGTISIGDRDVTELPPPERDIAMVFQNYALYPHMNVRENLGFGLSVRHTPKPRDRAARRGGRDAARPRGAARPQARAPLRRAASARRDGPRDHPRAGGVPDGRAALEPRREAARRHARVARAAARAAAVTSIYVTHDQTEAMTLGHRVAVMRDGRSFRSTCRSASTSRRRPLRRGVHRLPVDEPRRGDRRRRHGRLRSVSASRSRPAAARRAASNGSCSASARRRSTTPPSRRDAATDRGRRSTCSRSSAPTRTSSSASRRRASRSSPATPSDDETTSWPRTTRVFTARVNPATRAQRRRAAELAVNPAELPLLRPSDRREPALAGRRSLADAGRQAAHEEALP